VVTRGGDLVVGDDDGVVVVPSDRITDVAAAAQERFQTEAEWLRRIESGEKSIDVLGLKTK
jgi:4-hydroxy-4-methyl-2-oxoglutarate aldolase